MPAQWTGAIVGELHNKGITAKQLAAELDWHEKYLSRVLNSADPPKRAEEKVRAALERIIRKTDGSNKTVAPHMSVTVDGRGTEPPTGKTGRKPIDRSGQTSGTGQNQ